MNTIVPALQKQTFVTEVGQTQNGEASAIATTQAVDRERDIIVTSGIDLSTFRKNGPILFGHDHFNLPVGMCTRLEVGDDNIRIFWKWLPNDPRAAAVKNAWDNKALNALSIGFLPLAYVPNEHGGFTYTKTQLLEVSVVCVPANAEALRTLKKFGLDGPSAIAHPRLQLHKLMSEVKAGRVLSSANEDRLRQVISLLNEILAQTEGEDTDDDEEKEIAVVVDGETPMTISEDTINRAVAIAVSDELTRATGKLFDIDDLMPQASSDQPVIEMSENDLNKLITDIFTQTLREGINALTGRVD